MTSEAPKYRTTKEPVGFINSTPYYPNTEVEFLGWPKDEFGLKPVNDAARTIAAYYEKRRFDAFLPPSPRDPKTGAMYLPGMTFGQRGNNFPQCVAEDLENDAMPMWLMTSSIGEQYGRRHVEHGETFAYLGWPEPTMSIRPANEAAQLVSDYFERAGGLPKMLTLHPSPWNEFDSALYLPPLPQEAERTVTPPVSHSTSTFNSRNTLSTHDIDPEYLTFRRRDPNAFLPTKSIQRG